jgi:predicted nucleotidyltransferase
MATTPGYDRAWHAPNTAMTPTGINRHVLRTLRALEPELRAAGVRHISVFGSVARGEDTATSDVDLALDLAPDTTPPGFNLSYTSSA